MADTKDALDAWGRKWRTLWCWSQLYLGYKTAQARGRMLANEKQKAFWEEKHGHLAERMWSNISELRGWWVKVGQFLSTRGDLLPVQYIHHLTKLQDMMPTSSFAVIKQIIEEELGRPLDELFDDFGEAAIASASIGQVHRAVLKTGEKVVVKIQHPGVDKTLSQDMMTLTQMSWAFGMLEKGLNFAPLLLEWQKAAANELDFRIELQFQERARLASLKSGIDVVIPICYPEFTTKKVMVMEFCEGFKVTDQDKLKQYNVDTDVLMTKICKSFAYQIHVDGMFNGDPHPGNILVQIDEKTGEARPVLLDWGLVKSFSETERIAFAKTVYSVANMDVMGLMAAFEDMGFRFKTDSVIDPELYMDALRIGFFRDTGSVETETTSATSAVKQSGVTKKQVMEKNPIDDWPKDIIFFIRVASLLHGLCFQLNAKIPFLQLLVDKAEQCLLERYSAPSPLVYIRYPAILQGKIRSTLEWKVHRFLTHLLDSRNLLLGCQVAVMHAGKLVVDTCVGRMGPINTRPVQHDSLFCVMTVCNGLLSTVLLNLLDKFNVSLEDPVCHIWDGFIRFGKQGITIREALSHRAGLHRALPNNLNLTQLTDYEKMIELLENTSPTSPMGKEGGQYSYLTSGWVFSEMIRGLANTRIDEHFRSQYIRKMGLGTELFYPVPKALVKSEAKDEDQQTPDPTNSAEFKVDQTSSSSPKETSSLQTLETVQELTDSIHSPSNPQEPNRSPSNVFTFEMDLEQLARQQSKSRRSFRSKKSSPSKGEKHHIRNLNGNRKVGSPDRVLSPNGSLGDGKDGSQTGRLNLKTLASGTPTLHPFSSDELYLTTPLESPPPSSWLLGGSSPAPPKSPTPAPIGKPTLASQTPEPQTPDPSDRISAASGSPADSLIDFVPTPTAELKSPDSRPPQTSTPQTTMTPKTKKQLDILSRFTSSRREIGIARISNKEVMEKLAAAKKAGGAKSENNNEGGRFKSKHLHKLQSAPASVDPYGERGSILQLAKSKPHVLDPLVYDSRRLHHLCIPTNCRATARALAKFYNGVACGKLVSKPLLAEASKIHLIDDSLESLLLTGGGSRLWGLGYQLYPTVRIPDCFPSVPTPPTSPTRRGVSFSLGQDDQDQSEEVMGIGHGDLGGSVALCFPELKLSIAILCNDILTGPIASREILQFILNCFGVQPAWDVPYSAKTALEDLNQTILMNVTSSHPSTAALRKQKEFHVAHVIPPNTR